METHREVLFKILKKLGDEDFKEFKWYLQGEVLEITGIPKSKLEKADRGDTVDLMLPNYGIHTIKVTREVLKKIPRNDLVAEFSESSSECSSDSEGENLLSDGLEDPLSGLETLRLDHGGEQRFKPGLRKYSCELTLDSNTAERYLKLSEDNRKVTRMGKREQPYPDHPERFDSCPQLMCREALTGRCYWEVEWRGEVDIAVTYKGIRRKGGEDDSWFGLNDQSWCLECSDGGYSVRHNDRETPISFSSSSSSSRRVAVYLDHAAGSLSFYRVSSDKLIHLHTFRTTFTEPLYAGFGFTTDGASASLCPL